MEELETFDSSYDECNEENKAHATACNGEILVSVGTGFGVTTVN